MLFLFSAFGFCIDVSMFWCSCLTYLCLSSPSLGLSKLRFFSVKSYIFELRAQVRARPVGRCVQMPGPFCCSQSVTGYERHESEAKSPLYLTAVICTHSRDHQRYTLGYPLHIYRSINSFSFVFSRPPQRWNDNSHVVCLGGSTSKALIEAGQADQAGRLWSA